MVNKTSGDNSTLLAAIMGLLLGVGFYFGTHNSFSSETVALVLAIGIGVMWFLIFKPIFAKEAEKDQDETP